jgi:plastocyanin
MKLTPILLASLALFTLGQAPRAARRGTITGTVVLAEKGRATKPADVWVYLEDRTPRERATRRPPGADVKGVIVQSGQEFHPHVLLVPAGATVAFPNQDDTDHSVFSPPRALNGTIWEGFDLGVYGKMPSGKSRKFVTPGEFDIFCDKHMKMWAKVKVVPSASYAQVNEQGAFTITDVPPGTYRVWAWAPESKDVPSEDITITGEESKALPDLHVQSNPRPKVHTRQDGSQYDYSQYQR